MIRSLQFRLLVAFSLIIVLIIGVGSVFVARSAASEITAFQQHEDDLRVARIESTLTNMYLTSQGWSDIQPFVQQMGTVFGQRLVLADSSGTVVADSDTSGKSFVGKAADKQWAPAAVQLQPVLTSAGPQPLGTLYVNPETAGQANPVQGLVDSVNHFLLWGGLAAVLIAFLVTFWVSRRMTAPVHALSVAARRLGQGDFKQRVAVRGNDEIAELGRSFNLMAGDLEQAEQVKKDMVSDAAHELRTPLSNIRGYLEAMKDGVVQPDAVAIQSLHDEALLMSRLVDELQELTLADAGRLQLFIQTEDMNELARNAAAAVQAKAESLQLSVKMELAASLPPCRVDAQRVGQVLRNLLANAMAHTPPGGAITISTREEEAQVRVEVADTGEGISPEDLPRVFERFFRSDRSRARGTGGSGLGLTIVKRLVEAQGGTVGVSSEAGRGSVFWFTVPEGNLETEK